MSFGQDVWVNGYTRANGTYVSGHYRTRPDNTINNNFSTVGNVNPYTGKSGTVPRESYSTAYLPPIKTEFPSVTNSSTYTPPPRAITYTPSNTTSSTNKGGKYFKITNGTKNYTKHSIKQ